MHFSKEDNINVIKSIQMFWTSNIKFGIINIIVEKMLFRECLFYYINSKGVRRLADGTIKIAVDLDSSQLEQALGDRE